MYVQETKIDQDLKTLQNVKRAALRLQKVGEHWYKTMSGQQF